MDLVDLNQTSINMTLCYFSRDPYGSRGSKYYITEFTICVSKSRDPYGSRGSKFLLLDNSSVQKSRDPYGSRGSKYTQLGLFI